MSRSKPATEILRPEVMFVGDIPVVLPKPLDRLPPTTQGVVSRCEVEMRNALAKGHDLAASRLGLALEAKLGVTTQDRLDAVRPKEATDVLVERAFSIATATATEPEPTKAKRQKPLRNRPCPKAPEVGLTVGILEAWERHRANLTNPNPKIRQHAWDEMSNIERRLMESEDLDWRQRAIAETVALARDRGEEVEHGKLGKKTRLLSRGGFDAARAKGYLDGLRHNPQELFDVGRLYQDCFERVEGQMTPDRSGSAGGGRGGPQHALLHCAEVLTVLRSGQTKAQVVALDLVVALDIHVDLAAQVTGRHRLTMLKRLRDGLCIANDNWRGRPKEDQHAETKHTLALKHEAILSAQRSVA